jgi:DNA polymerase alpha subunit B
MDTIVSELRERFSLPSTDLGQIILAELQSIIRIHDITPEDLSFKWESYCMKMGAEETHLDPKTVRDFKKDLQESLEREIQRKVNNPAPEKRTITATPRAGITSNDMFDLYVYLSSPPLYGSNMLQYCSTYSSLWCWSRIGFKKKGSF